MLYNSILETIGNTPLVKLNKICQQLDLPAEIYAKVESFNPAGSIKDRVAYQMIKQAMSAGTIKPDSIIVEATSGNTGIGLALVCAYFKLKLIIIMPDTMSVERQKLIKGYGAELILTSGAEGMSGSIVKAQRIVASNPKAIIAGQFVNPNNPLAHYLTTGEEIYQDLSTVDIFVAGIGTGGTVSGVGKILKQHNNQIEIYGVEPASSAVINGEKSGPHQIQGIGAGFIPETLDVSILSETLKCSNEDAFKYSKLLMECEGISTGISSGASLYGAIVLANRKENRGKKIVCLLPDSGDKYLSTALFQ